MKALTGFQKAAVRESERQRKAAAAKATIPPLEPAFPYAVESFDFSFFNVPANPEPKK